MANLSETVHEVVMGVLPITVVVFLLQFTIIWVEWPIFIQFVAGTLMVVTGLILFLLGVHVGLLPIGERIGSALPRTGKLWFILLFSFILGFVVTVAEPDVRVLASYVDTASEGAVDRNILVYAVALGLAFFVAVSMLKIIFSIPIIYILTVGYAVVFILAWFSEPTFLPISFDSGGVTTGPMAVPFILALGVGVASVLKGKSGSGDGFGLVALASIGPIIAVLILGMFFS
ncbi:MAG: DUF1538 domain-containing protein [Bacteroidetes bacterium]|nr:DUF1538 domain-containing protein [Bacteroidota bacterium]MCH8524332.1 DUF1538 domain-containing protein [Balneolales bacterium]